MIKTNGSEWHSQVKQDGQPLPVSYLHIRLPSNRTHAKAWFLNTVNTIFIIKTSLLNPQTRYTYLHLVFIGYHLYLTYAKCPRFSFSFFFAFSLMHSSVYTKNSNAYNSICIMNTALKLLSVG